MGKEESRVYRDLMVGKFLDYGAEQDPEQCEERALPDNMENGSLVPVATLTKRSKASENIPFRTVGVWYHLVRML